MLCWWLGILIHIKEKSHTQGSLSHRNIHRDESICQDYPGKQHKTVKYCYIAHLLVHGLWRGIGGSGCL